MTGPDVFFEKVEEPLFEEDSKYDEGVCRCRNLDGIWLFTMEEGSFGLTHKECGNAFPDEALLETVFMDTTEVLLSVEGADTCQCYHGCDCDPTVVLTLPR